jgi:signal transduction histidine kinase
MALVEIANDGRPIPEYVRERLWVERITTKDERRSGKGGLGLLFVRWAMEAMDGSVRLVQAERPVTFEIGLPLVARSASAPFDALEEVSR